ncbi:ammonium transporter [Telmatocola sphagniphila]|uniref:Ammonium transporter n=2 Tax=Telmatocola sphagniphila TaxID=1123043 RepID=A0A8E6F0R1_9BACT|nr:ammonium transporter [Telmatocola sphagniphila]
MLISSALVMLMVPGLALFYGGMVRKKNILATMMQSYAALAIVGLYWVMCGYGLAFGPSINFFKVSFWGVSEGGLVGWHPDLFFLRGIAPDQKLPGNGITVYLHCMFQGMFAIITPALISGALAERIRFWPFCIYMILWVTVVYCPLAHMVWANDFFYDDPLDEAKGLGGSPIGFLGKLGALDFAGGTVVHIAAGTAGLACALVLRRRLGYPKTVVHPNSMVLTLLGAGLLWFGWFGFNGGSALNSSPLAGSAFAATQAAAAAAGLSWIFVEWLFKGKPTALGMASGIVAGLVAVTPASGFVFIWGGVAIGVLAGVLCYFAVSLKGLFGYDDSLDAFGVHAVGGFLGAILTGFFCYAQIQPASADGYFAVPSVLAAGPVLDEKIKKVEADLPAIKKAAEAADAELTKAGDKADDKLKESTAVAKGKLSRLEAKLEGLKKDKETNTKAVESYKKDNIGPMTQVMKQVKAACLSAGFAFVASLLLAILVQILTLGNFTTSAKEETEGLDHTEHGEVGFDFGLGIESSTSGMGEPKAAKMPPGGKRFSIEIEGTENGSLMKAWSELCVPQTGAVDADFKAVYPHVTTVQGTKFYFRGGDSKKIASHLSALFKKKLGKPVTVKINET